MKCRVVAFVLVALGTVAVFGTAPAQTASHAKTVPHPAVTANAVVSITPPGDLNFAFKDGPGKAAAQQYCVMCHSTAYVSTQPPLNGDQWTAEVVKMQKVYGAPIPDAAVAPIADYLTRAYGSPAASAPPTVPTAVPSGASR